MSEIVAANEGVESKKGLLNKLERLAEAGKAGDFGVVLDDGGLFTKRRRLSVC